MYIYIYIHVWLSATIGGMKQPRGCTRFIPVSYPPVEITVSYPVSYPRLE